MRDLVSHPDALFYVYVAMAVGVFTLLSGLYQLIRRSENRSEARSRRMQMVRKGASAAEILAVLKPVDRGHWMTRLPFVGNVPRKMRQAGMTASPGRVMALAMLLSLVVAAFVATVSKPLWAVPVGLLVGFGLPIAAINRTRTQRLNALTKQLPEALDLMARGLRVGHPLNTSIAAVAVEMPDPIGTEFGLIADQVSFGDDLVDAFAEFAERLGLEDVQYLSASIGIQHGTGGDLARVLEILSKVIRGRMAMRRRIQAISAEGRLTAYFLSCLPIFIFLATSWGSPDYYRGIMGDPFFLPMAIAIVTLVIANALVLTKLVKFRI